MAPGTRDFTTEEVDAAVDRLTDSANFAEAEAIISRVAPGLQKILVEALNAGGWFGEAHDAEVLKAATTPDEAERLTAVRSLLAEETRLGMMVGVAVGWTLREELESGPGDAVPGDAETENTESEE